MAIGALYGMDIVGAGEVGEGGIHLLDIEAAVGKTRVAGSAGGARLLSVLEVAGEAAQTFVYADGSAVVAGTGGAAG